MTVTIIVELSVKPDLVVACLERFAKTFEETRARDGLESITAYRRVDAPNEILIVERWRSREDHARYLEWRKSAGAFNKLAEWLLNPIQIRCFSELP